MQANQNKILSTIPHWQADVRLSNPEKQGSSWVTVSWNDQCHHAKRPSFCFPSNFIVQHDAIWYGISFGQFRSAVLVLLPPSNFCTHSCTLAGKHDRLECPRLCLSAALQQLIQLCIITSIFIKNPKHNIM